MDPVSILSAVGEVFTVEILVYMAFGIAIGTVFGAIPGLTGPTAMVLLLPLTFFMDPVPALLFMLSIYFAGLYGGAITAILFNAPGNPAAVATVFDGYPLARQGRPSYALGLAVSASAIGGFFGLILLVLLIEPLANFAVQFVSAELFVLALLGVLSLASLGRAPVLISIFAGLTGLMLGTVGVHASGAIRGTFGLRELYDGLPLVATLMGLFLVAEMLDVLARGGGSSLGSGLGNVRISLNESLTGTVHAVVRYPITLLRSSAIGTFLGLLPGIGGPVAAIMAYDTERRTSKNKEQFGKGAPEGVVAAESADNATEGGALATGLALGVPGSVGVAVLLAAITLQGFVIGPRLLVDHTHEFALVLAGALVAELLLLPIGLAVSFPFAFARKLSIGVLAPALVAIAVMGAYLSTNFAFEAQALVVVGILGWLARLAGLPLIPLVVGLILGPILDSNYTRLLQGYPEGPLAVFTRPISTVLVILLIAVLVIPPVLRVVRSRRKKTVAAGPSEHTGSGD